MMNRMIASALLALALSSSMAKADVAPSTAELIYLTEPAGEALFMEAELRANYFKLASYVETEQILTFCGPATIAAVMNSLDVARPVPIQFHPWSLFTQDSVFTPENQALKAYPKVENEGLVLEELAQFFRNLKVQAEYKHADAFDVGEFRTLVRETLSDPNKRLVVNYFRTPLGQAGGGHISPAAAYDEDTDRLLVLDVARYKYAPVWIKLADLHTSMLTIDASSGKMRGIVAVTR
jgi:hypothetical protein